MLSIHSSLGIWFTRNLFNQSFANKPFIQVRNSCLYSWWRHICAVKVQQDTFSTSALDRSQWPASRSGRFICEQRAPVSHSVGVWVGPRSGQDVLSRKQNFALAGIRTPDVSARSAVITLTGPYRLHKLRTQFSCLYPWQ